jgi:AraC-like DNA-binding protein
MAARATSHTPARHNTIFARRGYHSDVPRGPHEPAVPSAIVPALLRWLTAHGHDPAPLAERLALAADAADRDELDVVPSAIGESIEAAAALTAEPFLALRLPAELPFRRYGLGELAARAAPTLRDSLTLLAPLVHPLARCAIVSDDWLMQTPAHPRGIGRFAHEYGLAYVVTHARAVLGGAVPIQRVWFAHARPHVLAPIERWFSCEDIAFGAPDSGLTFGPAVLDRPLVTADARLTATIADLVPAPARSDDLASRVAAHVRERLPDPTSADDAAALLHMSARTLQRRLEADGTSFTAVVDATREALARELLADARLALAEISYRLGFADVAAFSRAFKRWTGTPPGRFRRA